jgi:hypothetical protein
MGLPTALRGLRYGENEQEFKRLHLEEVFKILRLLREPIKLENSW